MSRARSRAWRATLSALAGGGLTAAGLAGPLAGGALGAGAAGSPSPGEGSTTPASAPAPPPAPTTAGTSDTAQQPANTSPTTTPVPSAPTPSVPPQNPPAASTPAPSAASPATGAAEVPTVVLQRRQRITPSRKKRRNLTATRPKPAAAQPPSSGARGPTSPSGPNGVAPSPQILAAQAGALAAVLASSQASVQALGFYRIPLFLLPIYRAAASQYGVPWQILAAINEVETNYGSDQSVSSAGAEGWMQFEPATWLQYGVDALAAGYADPYNPVDAIFAAARYLHAAGASRDLRTAILAYNHSDAYASSVLLRAKLISSYPKSVIATLTGLVDARLPVTGKQILWGSLLPVVASASSATANAKALTAPAPTPAAAATGAAEKGKATPLFVDLMSARNASVVAVQAGRVVGLGRSNRLGKYVILRDIYGDVFTYAGLGSIAPRYRLPKVPVTVRDRSTSALATNGSAAQGKGGSSAPVTLQVKRSHAQTTRSQDSVPASPAKSVPPTAGKVRLFANPGNPDALAAAARVTTSTPAKGSRHGSPLRRGSLVAEGTVLGRVRAPSTARDGHLRFAVQPAGDAAAIDPGPVLANWKELRAALHPQGAKGQSALLGATASDVFLLSKSQLELTVLSDVGIVLDAHARHEVASGVIDRRVLAVLSFLSRSGLKPTVQALHRGPRLRSAAGGHISARNVDTGGAVDIVRVNGIPIAGHEGAGSITDSTIRTLLSLQREYAPSEILSLMKYPGAANTLATRTRSNALRLDFQPSAAALALTPARAAKAARAATAGRTAPAPFAASGTLNARKWTELLARIGAIPAPRVALKPTSAAIRDPQPAPSNRGLGVSQPSSGG